MQLRIVFITLSFFIDMLSACSSSNDGFPAGEYRGISGRQVTFYPDGTYTMKSTAGDLVVENAPSAIEGNILKRDDGKDNICMGFEGEYEWSPGSDGGINLKLVT